MTAPDVLPMLSPGAHPGPQQGACLNEYVAFLCGEPWTDNPTSVHIALRRLGAAVNDHTSDARRHQLATLIPRLMHTAPTVERVNVLLGGWLATHAPEGPTRRRMLREATRWARQLAPDAPTTSAGLAFAAEAADLHMPMLTARSTRDEQRRWLLEQTCDQYDRLTGRTPPVLTAADWRRCAQLVRTG